MSLIDPLLLQGRLQPIAGRVDVDALAVCDSTNSELMRRADRGAPSGSVLVADAQTAGRGRRGRVWLSAPENSLTFSLLWRFPGSPARLAGLSLAVGVALAQALGALGARGVALKWPNDVLVVQGDRFAKLAGILVELSSDRRGTQAIIGIGLNVSAPPQDPGQPVGALADVLPVSLDRHDLLAAILCALVRVLDTFAAEGFGALRAAWSALNAWADQPVQVSSDGQMQIGICRGVDAQGALLLENAAGVLETILAGDVSLRRV